MMKSCTQVTASFEILLSLWPADWMKTDKNFDYKYWLSPDICIFKQYLNRFQVHTKLTLQTAIHYSVTLYCLH